MHYSKLDHDQVTEATKMESRNKDQSKRNQKYSGIDMPTSILCFERRNGVLGRLDERKEMQISVEINSIKSIAV